MSDTPSSPGPGESEGLRERTRRRMAAERIPMGTDDPTLLALGASPLRCLAHLQDEPCPTCAAYIAAGL